MRFVVIESPYAGEVLNNVAYAKKCMKDCLNRGEAPFASHLLYPLILDDTIAAERDLGMMCGFEIGKFADATVVYTDRGITAGMKAGIERAARERRLVEFRTLPPEVEPVPF